MTSNVKLPAEIKNLHQFIQFISQCVKDLEYPRERISEIELAVEEALVNICHYAYPGKTGEVEVRCHWEEDHQKLTIEIEDEGVPFDIGSCPDPELACDISGRKVGGLGVFFIKKLVNEVQYRREGDHNVLIMIIYPDRFYTPKQSGQHLHAA